MEETEPATAADPKTKRQEGPEEAAGAEGRPAPEGTPPAPHRDEAAPYPESPDDMAEAPPSGAEDRPGDDAEPDPTVPTEKEADRAGAMAGEPDVEDDQDETREVQPEEPGSMLGIAPRAEAIVTEREMSPQEKAILQDLEESMDPEDRDNGEETPAETPPAAVVPDTGTSASTEEARVESGNLAAPAAVTAAATKPKKKPLLPWWAAVLLYGGAGAFAIYTGMEETRTVMKVIFIALGLYLLYGAYEAVRDRTKADAPQPADTQPATPPPSPPESPPSAP